MAVMVIWAWLAPTVWALVAGNLVNTLANVVLSHCIFPNWRVRFQWDPDMAKEIVRFGKWIFLTSALTFFAGQIDRLTLAKLMPLDLVGIYSIGFMWANLPLQLIQSWTGRVMFPLASETLRDPNGNHNRLIIYRRRMIWLSSIGVGLFGGLITPVYRLLYTPEYWQGAQFLQIILFGVLIRILDEPYRTFNLARGQPKYTSIGTGASILIFGAAVYPLYEQYSIHGIAMAYSISQVGTLAASFYGARKAGLVDLMVDIAATIAGLAIWAALYFATRNIL